MDDFDKIAEEQQIHHKNNSNTPKTSATGGFNATHIWSYEKQDGLDKIKDIPFEPEIKTKGGGKGFYMWLPKKEKIYFKSGVCQLGGASVKKIVKKNENDNNTNNYKEEQELEESTETDPAKKVYGHKEWKFTFVMPETEEKMKNLLEGSGFPTRNAQFMTEWNVAFIQKHKEVTDYFIKKTYEEQKSIIFDKTKDLVPTLMSKSLQNFVDSSGSSKGFFFIPGEEEENKPKMIWVMGKGWIDKGKSSKLYSKDLEAYKIKHGLTSDPPLVETLWEDTCKVILSDKLAEKLGRKNKTISYDERKEFLKPGAMVSFLLRFSGLWIDKGGIFHKQDVEEIAICALSNLKPTSGHKPTKSESMFDEDMDEFENGKESGANENNVKEERSIPDNSPEKVKGQEKPTQDPIPDEGSVLKKQKIELKEVNGFEGEEKGNDKPKADHETDSSDDEEGGEEKKKSSKKGEEKEKKEKKTRKKHGH